MRHLILLILLILLSLLFLHPFEGGGDFYHHVNTGQEIINDHTFPYTDSWTFTQNGKPWIAHSWAGGLVFYSIYQNFGPIGISVMVSVFGLIIFGLLYLLLHAYKVPFWLNLIVLASAIPVILIRFPNRPELFTYVFVISLLLIDIVKKHHPKIVWLFILTIFAWTNLYGSSTIFGLGLLGLFAVKQFLADRGHIEKTQKFFFLSLILGFLASFINPNTYKSVFYIFFIPQVSQYEGEWADIRTILTLTPDSYLITAQYQILIYIVYLIFIIVLALFSLKLIRKNLFVSLLALSLFIPIQAFRLLPLCVILTLPFLGLALNHQKKYIKLIFTISVGIITLGTLMVSMWLRPIGYQTDTSSLDRLTTFIAQNKLYGKAFTHENLGSFLSFQFPNQIQVYIDTRDDLFLNTESFKDLYNTQMSGSGVIPLLDKYHADLVVADYYTDSLNYSDLFNSSSWVVVYFDDRYIVALPKHTAIDKNIPPVISANPFSPTAAQPDSLEAAEKYYENTPDINSSVTNQFLLIQTLIAQNKYQTAIRILRDLKIPGDPIAPLLKKQQDYFLTKSYLKLSDCQNSGYYLNQLEDDITGKFIFSPDKKLPVVDEDLKALYAQHCTKNQSEAQSNMKQYLNRTDVNPKDKIRFQTDFLKSN